jgi:hypothetical protein
LQRQYNIQQSTSFKLLHRCVQYLQNTLVGCDLNTLQTIMQREDALTGVLSPSTKTAAARRGKTPTDTPKHQPDPSPPSMAVLYPPTKGIPWTLVKTLCNANSQCPVCYNRNKFHLDVGCPALAQAGFVIVKDEAKAKSIINAYHEWFPPRNAGGRHNNPDGRSGGRGGVAGRGTGGRTGGARRATSGERTPAPPPPPPQEDASNANRYASLADEECKYIDFEEMASDE